MSDVQLADAVITINNDVIAYVPNSASFTEGLGEQQILAQSEGGGRTSQVFANDLESNFAKITLDLRTTVKNIERAKGWKQNANRNVINISGVDTNGNDVVRSFTKAALVNDYDVKLQAEGTIELEFMSDPPS